MEFREENVTITLLLICTVHSEQKKTKHFSALEPKDIPELLLALNGNAPRLYHRTIRATRISMLTFARPSEICGARWSEIDFERRNGVFLLRG
jgi:integrase